MSNQRPIPRSGGTPIAADRFEIRVHVLGREPWSANFATQDLPHVIATTERLIADVPKYQQMSYKQLFTEMWQLFNLALDYRDHPQNPDAENSPSPMPCAVTMLYCVSYHATYGPPMREAINAEINAHNRVRVSFRELPSVDHPGDLGTELVSVHVEGGEADYPLVATLSVST